MVSKVPQNILEGAKKRKLGSLWGDVERLPEEAFIGWMSSAALMAVVEEQKKAKNGRGPFPPARACLDSHSCKMEATAKP